MTITRITAVGAIGVNKDLSAHELPPNAWTDAQNIRFLDGFAYQFYGHGEVYNSPSEAPQHVMPINIGAARYWIYTTAAKTFCVIITAGAAVHTDITHLTPRTGVVNQWTSTSLSGIPILNVGDAAKVPMSWNLNTANKFVDLANWPAATYCKSLRAFNNTLVALNITKTTTNYPAMVKWSHPADPGAVPASWDPADATKDAGEFDLAAGGFSPIVDGMQLGNVFMIYTETEAWRMELIGGAYVYKFTKVPGLSGVMNRNCIADAGGFHVLLTGSDVVVHDGQLVTSVLDKASRRYLFQNIDVINYDKCFVFKNPYFNEIFICYPSIGSTSCDKAMVWNYIDKTVAFRSLPNLNHAAFGSVDTALGLLWSGDADPWMADLSLWNGPDFVPSTARVIMGSADVKLYMLDASASFNGAIPSAYLERRGLSFVIPESIKLVRGIRPRIVGNTGETVLVYVGASDDPYLNPVYGPAMTHTIGSTISDDCMVSGRYIAIKFATGTAYQWRLDSYDIDIEVMGAW